MLSEYRFEKTCQAINEGGIVALPTEGVWGFSCRFDQQHTVQRLFRIKRRSPAKGLILLVKSFEQLAFWYACEILKRAQFETGRPSTWVIPVTSKCPRILTGGRATLAVRRVLMPSLIKVIDQCGPIVSTSANLSGRVALMSRREIVLRFGHYLDAIAYGRTQGYKKSSTIRMMETGEILRD